MKRKELYHGFIFDNLSNISIMESNVNITSMQRIMVEYDARRRGFELGWLIITAIGW